jgi:hypothetical protein
LLVAQNAPARAEHEARVAAHERRERFVVAFEKGGEERAVRGVRVDGGAADAGE